MEKSGKNKVNFVPKREKIQVQLTELVGRGGNKGQDGPVGAR